MVFTKLKIMKANFLLTTLFVFSFSASFAQWTVQTSPTKSNLNAIAFYNARIGFAVGDAGTVLRTINEGKTWQQMNFPFNVNLGSVVLPDSAVVIVSSITNLGSDATYRSTDGGLTWQRSLADTRPFYVTATPDKRLFCSSSQVYESDNNGISWSPRAELNSTTSFTHLSFPDNSNGYVAGNISGFITYSAMFSRSHDGGLQWHPSFPYDFPNANGFSAMSAVNADSVFMFTNFYKGYSPGDSCQLILLSDFHLRRSFSDSEWHFKSQVIVNSFHDRLNTCKFFSNGIAYTAGDNGIMYRSNNYGKRWKTEFSNKLAINNIFMLNENIGYAVGDGGLIVKRETAIVKSNNVLVNDVTTYPNPANDHVNIGFTVKADLKITVQLTNANGIIVYAEPAKLFSKGAQQLTIPVRNLNKGVYQLNLISNNEVISKKQLLVIH